MAVPTPTSARSTTCRVPRGISFKCWGVTGQGHFFWARSYFYWAMSFSSWARSCFYWARSFSPKNDLVPSKNMTFGPASHIFTAQYWARSDFSFLLVKVIFFWANSYFSWARSPFCWARSYVYWARSVGPQNDLVPGKNLTFGPRRSCFYWAPTPPQ